MFSDKPSVNILTSLLVAHRIRKAVLCPGSRNAPICHNLLETNQIECFPVTDERSAAFVAIGLCLGTAHAKCGLMPSRSENEEQDVEIADSLNKPTTLDPVALCLTSGSAILDAAPAVAEASYQGIPLVVIAADRPAEWIDQKDGQTLPQPTALGSLVRCSVSLPLGNTPDELWYANRLVNHALMMASQSTNPGPFSSTFRSPNPSTTSLHPVSQQSEWPISFSPISISLIRLSTPFYLRSVSL